MRLITQRDLRKHLGELLGQAENGQHFTVTRAGLPIAELIPLRPRQWVSKAEVLTLLRSQPSDPAFFDDLRELGGTAEDLHDPWES